MLLLEVNDLFGDRRGQFGCSRRSRCGLQARFTELLIQVDPPAQAALDHTHLLADVRQTEAFFEPQPDGFDLFGHRIGPARFFGAASPPRGAEVLLSLLLYYDLFTHGNTPLNIGVSTGFPSLWSHDVVARISLYSMPGRRRPTEPQRGSSGVLTLRHGAHSVAP